MKYILTALLLLSITIPGFSQWNPNTSVNLEIAGINVSDQQTTTTSDGKTWIAYYNHNGTNYDMRAQLLDAGGNKLLGPDGVLVCNQTSGSATFVFNVCLDASDNLIIGFQYQVAGISTGVVTKVNTDGTLPWGNAGILLEAGFAPYPALLSTGDIVVALNSSPANTVTLQKINAAGAIVWASPIPVTVGASLTFRGQVVGNPNGNFTMVFQKRGVGTNTTLYTQRYDNNGTPQWVAPVQIATKATSTSRYYSILADADTTYFGYYASLSSRFYSYVQRINPDGSLPYGAEGGAVSTYSGGADPYQTTTNIAHAPNSPYVWAVSSFCNTTQSQFGVYVQKFDVNTGLALLNPQGKEVFPISANMDTQTGYLDLKNDDPIFMSYDVNYKIYATRLNSSGDFVWAGNRVELSSTTAGGSTAKGRFCFTKMVNDQMVAVWYENRGIEYRGYAQAFTVFGVLPVKINDFQAVKNGKTVDLFWNTASETNNTGFAIERSADGINFLQIGFTTSKAPLGNGSVNLHYSFTDPQPLKSYNYYRLRQIDFDGKSTNSKTAMVRFDKGGSLIINNIYPTPVITVLHISVTSVTKTNGNLSLVDMNGKINSRIPVQLNKGSNNFDIDLSSLAKGVYFLKLISDGETIVEKLIKE